VDAAANGKIPENQVFWDKSRHYFAPKRRKLIIDRCGVTQPHGRENLK
jgi:hypothetical protein